MSMDHESKALFWGRVLSPVLFKLPEDDRSDRQILLAITKEEFITTDGVYRSFSLSTLKRKLKRFRKDGVEGLKPSLRSDEGSIRGGREESLKRALEIKRENPFRSHSKINLILKSQNLETIPASTLNRQLRYHGATVRKMGYEGTIIRKRWSRKHTHSLWVGDFSQGPWVIDDQGKSHKTWNSAFIDAHSRFIVVSIYALTCDMDALVRSLLAAFECHGKPRQIYLDNAAVYRSPILERACLELNIELIHRTVRDPQGGGLIERFFLTAQKQFEDEIVGKNKTPLDLVRLNELFRAWLSQVYHKSRHSEILKTPKQCYTDGLFTPVNPIRLEEALKAFYNEVTRKVHKDFCDISIDNRLYRVHEKLRGDKILARFPLGEPVDTVDLYSLNRRKCLGKAELHDRSERRIPSPPPLKPDTTDFAKILMKLQSEDDSKKKPVLPMQHKHWDLATFVTKLCGLTDKNVGELSESDLQILLHILQRRPELGMKKLQSTWVHCEPQTLNQLLIELSK